MKHFIPTLCDPCQRALLTPLPDARQGDVTCPSCGGRARVVPGCSFVGDDRPLFEELSELVGGGVVARTEAQVLASRLWRATRFGGCDEVLDVLVARFPAMLPLRTVLGRNATAQRRTLVIFATILDALATARAERAET